MINTGIGSFNEMKRQIVLIISYIIIVIIVYFGMRFYLQNISTDESIDRKIYDAIEIKDDFNLNKALNNDTTYAIIYGTFICNDPIHSVFLNGDFSYIDEITITNGKDNIHNKTYGKSYSIYDTKIDGFIFDVIEPYKISEISDVRHSNTTLQYYVKSVSYNGSLLCEIGNNKITPIKYYDMTNINALKDYANNNVSFLENTMLLLASFILFLILLSESPFTEDDKLDA